MNPTSKLFFVLLVTLWAHQILGATPINDPITQACDNTLYKVICRRTLESNPASKGADLRGLARIALTAASLKATKAHDNIKILLSKNPTLKQPLTDCLENYEDAIQKFKDSLPAFESRRYNDVNIWVSSAMTFADSCDDGFSGSLSPVAKMSRTFTKLSSNALALTNKLH